MQNILTQCPCCQGKLQISVLQCSQCGMEIKGDFQTNSLAQLDSEQTNFLLSFLRCKGNFKNIQEEMQISYPTVKKKLDELLLALNLNDMTLSYKKNMEVADMKNWFTDTTSTKASEIIKTKLKSYNGKTIVYSLKGEACNIYVNPDGLTFSSNKLPLNNTFRFEIFDLIVDMLLMNNGHARKGNGRNYKLGHPNCDESTVVGYLGKHYFKAEVGKSVLDPVFVLAAVLDWAEIAHNERGELRINASYLSKLNK